MPQTSEAPSVGGLGEHDQEHGDEKREHADHNTHYGPRVELHTCLGGAKGCLLVEYNDWNSLM